MGFVPTHFIPGTKKWMKTWGYGVAPGILKKMKKDSEVDPNADPQQTAAELLRAQFENWQSFFKPIELRAMQQLSFVNPSVLPTALSEAEASATGAAGAMEGILGRQNRAMGIEPTSQQAGTTRRMMDLNKALSIAGAKNQARQNVRSQDEMILYGSSPNPNILRPEV